MRDLSTETLAARLKSVREAKGLTKYRLAKLARVSQTYIYRLEKGEIRNPRRDTLQALSRGLNISLAELLGETSPKDTWSLVEQSLKAYIPVYAGVDDMEPIDWVACTRSKVPLDTVRAYRIEGLSLDPHVKLGDTIIVDSSLVPFDGDLILVSSKGKLGEVGIAQFSKYHGSQVLIDERGNHELRSMNICGVITECVHRFRQM